MEKKLSSINKKGRKKIAEEINNYYKTNFNFKDNEFLLYEYSDREMYLISRGVAEAIYDFDKVIKYGLFFGRKKKTHIFLSIEGSRLVGETAKKESKILERNNSQKILWIQGFDLENYKGEGYIIIKNKDDFLGCGRFEQGKILNLAFK